MKLIIALGNPGPEYTRTRHNAGFMAIDRFVDRFDMPQPRTKFQSLTTDGGVGGEKCVVLKPMTYMNRSGQAVIEAVNFYKVDAAGELMIVVDDVALPCGRIRLRADGSAGGHNGLGDVERVLSSQVYPRLRIGIDGPGRARQKDYVLGRFSPDQVLKLEPALDRAVDAIEAWVTKGIDKAMTMYNG